MTNQTFISIGPYWDIIHRHRTSFFSAIAVGLVLTLLAVVVIPKAYTSAVLLEVWQADVAPTLIGAEPQSSSSSPHIESRLEALSQETIARGHLEDGKTTITWNLPRLLLPKNRVKLLLNMLVIAQQTIPRGGVLTVDSVGEGEAAGFRVAASGLNARMPQNIADMLAAADVGGVDAHAVQPYYTRLLAQACGLNVVLAAEGDAVVVTAS